MSKISPIVSDLETKRKASIQNAKFSDLSKLEQAYKDAVLGSANPVEIAKIREGLDAYIGELEGQLSAAKKLKEALALVATNGRRQNESYVKESKDKLKSLISLELSDPLKDTVNENVYKEAKISYGLVCCDLGDIFKNKLSSQSMGAAKNSKNLLAAYQAVKGKLDPQAKALYEEGYNAVKDLKLDAEDKAAGLDKNASAALLKNASELAKEDPSKLNDAKVKADSILAKLDSEGKTSFTLPTGEIVDKNDVLEEKGNAFINGGKPSESVQIFNEVTDEKVKNFGLGQAYMQLNALDKAFLNLKEAVKSVVKSENCYEARMQAEENFEAVNEALFAFAALLDKLKNGSEEDVVNFRKAIEALEANYSADEKIFTDAGITVNDILSGIKPTTSFYEAGEGFINGTQTDFGGQFVEYETYADPLWAQYEKAQNLLFESGNLVESLKSLAAISDRERILFKGTSLAGTAEAPAEGTAVKYLNDALAILESLHANASAENYLRCEAYYQSGMAYLSKYRAFKNANIKNKDLISRSLKTFFTIIEKSSDPDYANLKWIAREMIGEAENERNEADGMSAGANQFMQDGENYMNRAKSFAYDGFTGEASADFETSFKRYYEAYSKVATSEIKLKETALFYACSALYNKFKVDPQANAEDKDRAKRVLKNFSLEFANSSFLGEVRKMSGDLDTQFEIGGETYSEPSAQEVPGAEFERALALMDKLRMYYSNNFPASEIDPVIADAEAVFSAIFNAGQGAPDPKYFGTITSEVQVKSFKAVAKFQLAILYMERYFMSIDRNAAYKNLALRYFNELIMQNPEEYFIFDVKGFVESLQNEGKTEPVYDGGSPIISSVTLDPPSVRAGESSDFKVNVTADIMLPGVMDESGAASAVTTVEAQLFRFGNLVYSDEQMSVPVKTTLTLVNSRWTGSLIIPAAAVEPGPYDIAVTASADSGCADAYVPFNVKTADGSASISWIDTVGSDVLKVNVTDYPENVNNSYTDVYVTVLRADNSGQPELEGKFVPAEGVPANIKLERSTAENEIAYILELNRQVGDITPGTYMFMFKLVKYDAANPDKSLNNAVFSFPYSCYIEKVMPETDRNSIMKLYGGILSNYNDLTLSPEQRVAAVEAMHSPAGFKYGADARAALLEMLSSIDGMKVTAEDESYISYSPDGKATLYSYLRVDGVYKTDVPQGVFMPDGRMLLQPGYAGSKLYDFYISFEQSFVQAADGSWALSPSSDSGSVEPQPDPEPESLPEPGDSENRGFRAAK